jgi:hypothetical protein
MIVPHSVSYPSPNLWLMHCISGRRDMRKAWSPKMRVVIERTIVDIRGHFDFGLRS